MKPDLTEEFDHQKILHKLWGWAKEGKYDEEVKANFGRLQFLLYKLEEKSMVFVFGSNLAGVHGAGAAAYARQNFGARPGRGEGHVGNSYALPTKNQYLESLTLGQVSHFVKEFIAYAKNHPELAFKVTQIGCGLAGFTANEMAPLFKEAPSNCYFDTKWEPFLGKGKKYWGSF